MKKISSLLFTVFLTMGIVSCTPTHIVDDAVSPQACCGDDGEIPPPPPPPPKPGDGLGDGTGG